LTDSRNAWAIAVLACLAFALYQGWRWLVAGVGVIAGSVLWAAFGPAPTQPWFRAIVPAFFWARLSDQRYPDRPVALLRVTQWRFAWSLTEQRPWTGWGLRNFTPLYQAQMHTFIGHPHNLVLMMTAETGIPATLVLLGLVGWVMFRGVLLLRDWPNLFAQPVPRWTSDRLIFFSYLVAFGASTLFHLLDVTLFDARINILGWVLLSAICGLVYRQQAMLLQQKAIAADFEPS
jgi:O-antigen ligase